MGTITALRVAPRRRAPAPTYAPSGYDEEAQCNPQRDALLALTSTTRRVERALSGPFTTTKARADAKRLLADVERNAKALRVLL